MNAPDESGSVGAERRWCGFCLAWKNWILTPGHRKCGQCGRGVATEPSQAGDGTPPAGVPPICLVCGSDEEQRDGYSYCAKCDVSTATGDLAVGTPPADTEQAEGAREALYREALEEIRDGHKPSWTVESIARAALTSQAPTQEKNDD